MLKCYRVHLSHLFGIKIASTSLALLLELIYTMWECSFFLSAYIDVCFQFARSGEYFLATDGIEYSTIRFWVVQMAAAMQLYKLVI